MSTLLFHVTWQRRCVFRPPGNRDVGNNSRHTYCSKKVGAHLSGRGDRQVLNRVTPPFSPTARLLALPGSIRPGRKRAPPASLAKARVTSPVSLLISGRRSPRSSSRFRDYGDCDDNDGDHIITDATTMARFQRNVSTSIQGFYVSFILELLGTLTRRI